MPDPVMLAGDPGVIQIGSAGSVPVSWFLLVAALLFAIGTIGVLVRHNPIVVLVCIELMLNAVNLTLVAFSRQLLNLEGQLFALMTMVVAAGEAVVGLAILVDIFRVRKIDDVDELSELRG
jgi:NADH-quinone oxidoreductase subunit K